MISPVGVSHAADDGRNEEGDQVRLPFTAVDPLVGRRRGLLHLDDGEARTVQVPAP